MICKIGEFEIHAEAPSFFRAGSIQANEIHQKLDNITSILEELKVDKESNAYSATSFQSHHSDRSGNYGPSPTTDTTDLNSDAQYGRNNVPNSRVGNIDRDYDPTLVFMANSPENMLRWPVFRHVVSERERYIQSFVLDSISDQNKIGDDMPLDNMDTSQDHIDTCQFLSNVQPLCEKYIMIPHCQYPLVDPVLLRSYARDVATQGLKWDGKSCLVVCSLVFLYFLSAQDHIHHEASKANADYSS